MLVSQGELCTNTSKHKLRLDWLHTHTQFWLNTWRWHNKSWDGSRCPRCPQCNHFLPSKKASTLFRPTQPQLCCSCWWLSWQVSEVAWFFILYLPSAFGWTSRLSLCLNASLKSPFKDLYLAICSLSSVNRKFFWSAQKRIFHLPLSNVKNLTSLSYALSNKCIYQPLTTCFCNVFNYSLVLTVLFYLCIFEPASNPV